MRLINCRTCQMEEFIGSQIPEYAILSHTWEKDEITFQQYTSGQNLEGKDGYKKIKGTCELALRDGYEYAWVDTCCINKSSSAELTEAINSMFNWYRTAGLCYVYLSDFVSGNRMGELGQSRWFTRGWTLQELIAPISVQFYDRSWRHYGEKKETLLKPLSSITGIREEILGKRYDLSTASVAEKMSWAARRQTTREEDLAYCLLGIFEISMPLLYGEGNRAFKRLQEAIIKTNNDMSIFAWKVPTGLSLDIVYTDLLATSHLDFRDCGNIEASPMSSSEITMSNLGLRIHTELIKAEGEIVLPLNCYRHREPSSLLGVYLQQVTKDGVYVRVRRDELATYREDTSSFRFTISSIFGFRKRPRHYIWIYWTENLHVKRRTGLSRATLRDIQRILSESDADIYYLCGAFIGMFYVVIQLQAILRSYVLADVCFSIICFCFVGFTCFLLGKTAISADKARRSLETFY